MSGLFREHHSVVCPNCGSGVGIPCIETTNVGRRHVEWVHAARTIALRERPEHKKRR